MRGDEASQGIHIYFFSKILLAFTDGIEKIAKNTVIHQNLGCTACVRQIFFAAPQKFMKTIFFKIFRAE
jgi:hypothetical protein